MNYKKENETLTKECERWHSIATTLEKSLMMYAEPNAWVEVTKTDEAGTKEKMYVNKDGAETAKVALDLVKGM